MSDSSGDGDSQYNQQGGGNAHADKNWEWIACVYDMKRSTPESEITWNLSPSIMLTLPSEQNVQPKVDLVIESSKSFIFTEGLGWNWHKSWNIPDIHCTLDIRDPLTQEKLLPPSKIYAEIYVVRAVINQIHTFHLVDVGIKGSNRSDFDSSRSVFTGLKFDTTSYNHEGSKFHLVIVVYLNQNKFEHPKILESRISPPIFVDSRKQARATQQQKAQKLSSFIDPFAPENLDKPFVKRESKKKYNSDEPIGNNIDGLSSFFSAPNIRHKVKHPLFLAIKFSSPVKIYYNINIIPVNSNSEKFVEVMQKQLMEAYNRSSSTSTMSVEEKPLILTIEHNLTPQNFKSKKINEFLEPLHGDVLHVMIEPQPIPSNFRKLEDIDGVKEAYKKVYPKISQQKFPQGQDDDDSDPPPTNHRKNNKASKVKQEKQSNKQSFQSDGSDDDDENVNHEQYPGMNPHKKIKSNDSDHMQQQQNHLASMIDSKKLQIKNPAQQSEILLSATAHNNSQVASMILQGAKPSRPDKLPKSGPIPEEQQQQQQPQPPQAASKGGKPKGATGKRGSKNAPAATTSTQQQPDAAVQGLQQQPLQQQQQQAASQQQMMPNHNGMMTPQQLQLQQQQQWAQQQQQQQHQQRMLSNPNNPNQSMLQNPYLNDQMKSQSQQQFQQQQQQNPNGAAPGLYGQPPQYNQSGYPNHQPSQIPIDPMNPNGMGGFMDKQMTYQQQQFQQTPQYLHQQQQQQFAAQQQQQPHGQRGGSGMMPQSYGQPQQQLPHQYMQNMLGGNNNSNPNIPGIPPVNGAPNAAVAVAPAGVTPAVGTSNSAVPPFKQPVAGSGSTHLNNSQTYLQNSGHGAGEATSAENNNQAIIDGAAANGVKQNGNNNNSGFVGSVASALTPPQQPYGGAASAVPTSQGSGTTIPPGSNGYTQQYQLPQRNPSTSGQQLLSNSQQSGTQQQQQTNVQSQQQQARFNAQKGVAAAFPGQLPAQQQQQMPNGQTAQGLMQGGQFYDALHTQQQQQLLLDPTQQYAYNPQQYQMNMLGQQQHFQQQQYNEEEDAYLQHPQYQRYQSAQQQQQQPGAANQFGINPNAPGSTAATNVAGTQQSYAAAAAAAAGYHGYPPQQNPQQYGYGQQSYTGFPVGAADNAYMKVGQQLQPYYQAQQSQQQPPQQQQQNDLLGGGQVQSSQQMAYQNQMRAHSNSLQQNFYMPTIAKEDEY